MLPSPPKPVANYVSVVEVGHLIFTSGAGPLKDGRPVMQGRVGEQLTLEDGYEAAKLVMLNLLSALQAHLGTLNRIERIVKLLGFIASAPDFTRQPEVLNGASDLLVAIFGARGRHARSAIGTSVLPFGIPVEVEMIVEVRRGRTAARSRPASKGRI
jgi:enamine deaminase RidA (YjgF/YER057c/UK114 family)